MYKTCIPKDMTDSSVSPIDAYLYKIMINKREWEIKFVQARS